MQETKLPNAPKTWECYSTERQGAAANRSLHGKAETVLRKVRKLQEQDLATHTRVRKILVTFVASWDRMSSMPSYSHSGVSDTEPRVAVADFCDSVWRRLFGSVSHELWDELHSEAYNVNRKRRAS